VNLYTGYFDARDVRRQRELDGCLLANAPRFSQVVVLCDGALPPVGHALRCDRRPTFQDFLDACAPEEVNVIANTDVEFDHTLEWARRIPDGEVWAVSRDDERNAYSQDAWFFRGVPRVAWAGFPMGRLGCDSRFAWELAQAGWHVTNPCRSIRLTHRHASRVRTYSTGSQEHWVPKPYLEVRPCRLP
jgi:hypothetical protein